MFWSPVLASEAEPNGQPEAEALETTTLTDLPDEGLASGKPQVSMGLLRAGLQKTEIRSLDLEQALRIALEQNLTLKVTGDATRQSKAKYLGALADFLPDVGVAYNYADYNGAVQSITSNMLRMERKTFSPQLFFRFNLLQGGANIFLARYAKRSLEAQRLNEQAVTQDILRETAVRYYELERRLADLKASQQQLEESRENFLAHQQKQQPGADSTLDAIQAESQLVEARQQFVEAGRASEAAALRLNELLVLPAFVDTLPEAEPAFKSLVPGDMDFSDCLARSESGNPRLKALSKQISAMQEMLKGATFTSLLPEVNAQFRIGRTGGDRDALGYYKDSTASLSMVSRNMGMDSLTRLMDLKAQLSGLRSQLAEDKNRLQRILSEAHIRARAEQSQLDIVRQRVAVTERARNAALEQIKNGDVGGMNLIQAQAMLNQARRQLNETVLAYNQAQVDMIHAMGLISVETLTHGLQSDATQISARD